MSYGFHGNYIFYLTVSSVDEYPAESEETMKAALIDTLGETPHLADVPEPEAAEQRQVVRVRAAALKNIERMLAAGNHYGSAGLTLPARVGLDAVVEFDDGRLAYAGATPPEGTMAEQISVDPAQTVDLPSGLDPSMAAALPNAAISAWFALEFAGAIQPGQKVLILGATGITGGLAVQLARHRFGADSVVAAGRNEHRLRDVQALGADETLRIGEAEDRAFSDAVRSSHAERPFDLVLDFLWGAPAEQVLRSFENTELNAAFHRTRYVQIGETAGPTVELSASVLRSAGVELVGQGAGSVPHEAFARLYTEIIPQVLRDAADGILTINTVDYPLADVAAAWQDAQPSGVRAVLVP